MDGSKSFDPNAGGKMKHSTYWFLYINTDEKYFENLRESLKLYQIVIPPSNPPHLLNRYLPENGIY